MSIIKSIILKIKLTWLDLTLFQDGAEPYSHGSITLQNWKHFVRYRNTLNFTYCTFKPKHKIIMKSNWRPDLHEGGNEWAEILAFLITPSAAGNKNAKIREKW